MIWSNPAEWKPRDPIKENLAMIFRFTEFVLSFPISTERRKTKTK